MAGRGCCSLFQSDNFTSIIPEHWIIPLLGNQSQLTVFLPNSNVAIRYPVQSRNATSGFDNHSFSPLHKRRVFGMGENGL